MKAKNPDRGPVEEPQSEESALVQRIIATPAFVRSPLLTRFLQYVCERSSTGHNEEISEYQIGIYALSRPESYNPAQDNIVRNYARILRKRLDEYFTGEGRHEPIRIVIPRGSYVPQFVPNTSQVEVEEDVLPASEPAPAAQPRVSRKVLAIGLLIGVILVAACYASRVFARPSLYTVFWREILDAGRPAHLIAGDSGFAMLQDITGVELHLNDYISGDLAQRFPDLHLAPSSKDGTYGVDRFANFTSTADLSIAIRVVTLAQHYAKRIQVDYAREMHMEDIKASNVILLGGPHANPWLELFEPESNFRMEIPKDRLEGVHADRRIFVNKAPRAGEQSTYVNQSGKESRLTYALVSYLPSGDGAGHVVLLEGENMAGTRAAGDFFLDERSLEPVLRKALLPNGSVGPFEILLEARVVGANAAKSKVVAERFGVRR